MTPDDADVLTILLAKRIEERFNVLMGGPIDYSPVVLLAARDILRVFMGSDNPIAALDEVAGLEASLREEES